MQKKIIALAVASLVSGGAFAQSNVVISGQMRVGVDAISGTGATVAGGDYTSRTRVTDQNSNLRFSGTEGLGNGLTAWWQVESAIGVDNNTGTSAGNTTAGNTATIGTRNTAIGLKGNWGNAFIGKWDVHYNSMANIEIAGLAGGLALNTSSLNLLYSVGGVGGALAGAGLATSAGGGRFNNVIAYDTPNWSGFTGQLKYMAGSELTTPGLAAKDSGWNIRLAYDNGPIDIAYSYINYGNLGAAVPTVIPANNGQGVDYNSNRFGAAYSFPMGFKIGLIWDRSELKNLNNPANTTAASSSTAHRDAWALPMNYRMGPHNFSFTYAQANDTNFSGGQAMIAGNNVSTKAKMYMAGYEYALSKRTIAGVSYTMINNDNGGTYDFWHASSNLSNVSGLGAVNPGVDPRLFSVTMNHTF